MRKAFNFYRSYYDILSELSDKDKLQFLMALLNKQFNGVETQLTGQAKFAYLSQQHSINAQVNGWIDKCKDLKTKPFDNAPTTPSHNPLPQPHSGQGKGQGEVEGEGQLEVKIPFEKFWEIYPRKEGKPKSKEKWDKLKKEQQQKILDTLPKFLQGKELQFVPMPVTYFNNERWEDEIIVSNILQVNSVDKPMVLSSKFNG